MHQGPEAQHLYIYDIIKIQQNTIQPKEKRQQNEQW